MATIRDDIQPSDQNLNDTQKSVSFDNSKVQEVLGLDNTWKPGKNIEYQNKTFFAMHILKQIYINNLIKLITIKQYTLS